MHWLYSFFCQAIIPILCFTISSCTFNACESFVVALIVVNAWCSKVNALSKCIKVCSILPEIYSKI